MTALTKSPKSVSTWTIVFALCMLALAVMINLPYKYADTAVRSSGTPVPSTIERNELDQYRPTFTWAGYPLTYYLRSDYAGLPSLSVMAPIRLAGNLLIALSVTILLLVYFIYRAHRHQRAGIQLRKLTITDFLLLIVALAIPASGWAKARRDMAKTVKLEQEVVSSGGHILRRSSAPALIASMMPSYLSELSLQISDVTLSKPSEELVNKVTPLPYLQVLRIGGGNYSNESLETLRKNPLLWQLRISGRTFKSTQELQWLSQLPQLTVLNLMRTNVDAASVKAFTLPRLRDLNLIHTDVQLAKLEKPAWAATVHRIDLPRPVPGEGDHLQMQAWPELKQLSVFEYDDAVNQQSVMLELSDLPNLEELTIDRLQLFSLKFDNLPRLAEINSNGYYWQFRMMSSSVLPAANWIETCELNRVPMLRFIDLFAGDLRKAEFHALGPKSQVTIDIRGVSPADNNRYPLRPPPREQRQRWVDGLASSDGPAYLNLGDTPLDNLNLSGLAKNTGAQALNLSSTGTSPDQWFQLAGSQLEFLELVEPGVDGRVISWLCQNLPKLKWMRVSSESISTFRLENQSQIEQIEFEPRPPTVRALRLVNNPKLTASFMVEDGAQHLHIENTPNLSGLVIQGSTPATAVLQGLTQLQVFGGGGPAVNETVFNDILQCQAMRKLSLAYTPLSPAQLSNIGRFENLEHLLLAGKNIDDQVAEEISKLTKLKKLILVDTNITANGYAKLTSLQDLTEVKIDGSQLTESCVTWIASLPLLKSIEIRGFVPTASFLGKLGDLQFLERLNLIDTQLDAQAIDSMVQYLSGIVRLGLRGTSAPQASIIRLAQSNQFVIFDLDGSGLSSQVHALLAANERILINGVTSGQRSMTAMGFRNDPSQPYEWELEDPELIDPLSFVASALPTPNTPSTTGTTSEAAQ